MTWTFWTGFLVGAIVSPVVLGIWIYIETEREDAEAHMHRMMADD